VEWHRDPVTGEKIYHPELLAKKVIAYLNGTGYLPKGDCDDKATLLMSLLLNRGHICRAVAAWQSLIPPYPGCPDPQNPKWKRINHVYVEVKNPGKQNIVDGGTVKLATDGKEWLPLEPSSTTLMAFQQNSAVKPMLYFYSVVDGKTIK
jgi:transglutaminase-like putative cysteine protease